MKIADMMERLSKLDPDMDLNDLRECLTTDKADADKLVESLDETTDSWDEFSAVLTKDAVIPLLIEMRDLMLAPASSRGWLKPAEMAKKVAEQVEINEAKCMERISEIKSAADADLAAADERNQDSIDSFASIREAMRQEHAEGIKELKSSYEAEIVKLIANHQCEIEWLKEQSEERLGYVTQQHDEFAEKMGEAMGTIPSKQAEAAASVLADAADRLEAMAQMRLAKLVKRKSLFRNKDLDQVMLRVEADGIACSAKRLRKMAVEAEQQSVWPVEFAAGEEDSPEAKEALARILTPVREVDTATEDVEAEVG